MAITKKVSTQISQQVPDFIRSDAPLFRAFMEGYYEFLEQGTNALDILSPGSYISISWPYNALNNNL